MTPRYHISGNIIFYYFLSSRQNYQEATINNPDKIKLTEISVFSDNNFFKLTLETYLVNLLCYVLLDIWVF